MKNTIKCFVCGSTVKGSIRFEPYMKEKLGWHFTKDKEKAFCPRHSPKRKVK